MNNPPSIEVYPTEYAAKQESEKRLGEISNSTPKEIVFRAMKRLDSLMESCVQDYQKERDRINGADIKEKLIELNKEFLPIIERIGVSIADMYRLVEKPAQ